MNKFIISLILFPVLLFANTSSKKSYYEDFNFIKGLFEIKYAPLQWKGEFAGFDLDQKAGEAILAIDNIHPSDCKGYQRILKQFCNETKDYHVGVYFYATEEASLPFQVKEAEGRYFIVDIDRSCLPFSKFPLRIGDEILLFGGKPIAQAIEEFRSFEFGENTKETDQALAAMLFTRRSAQAGNLVPSGPVEVVGIKKGHKVPTVVTLEWHYYPERISGFNPKISCEPDFAAWRLNPKQSLKDEKFFERMMVYAGWRGSYVGNSLMPSCHALGTRSSYIPQLGKKCWSSKSDSYYDAYIFKANDRRIGYVRIPHYDADEDEVEEFCKLMKFFERTTDALVIDQINNPGGSVFYLYALVAALTPEGKEIEAPKHRIMLTQSDLYMAITILESLDGVESVDDAREVIGDTLGGYPLSMEMVDLLRSFSNFIIDQWSQGKFFSDPIHLFGVDKIKSHPDGVYTKPVLVLINELDFSAGDFFPATLQDAGRALLLGTRTAGAGGFVQGTRYPNRTGVAGISITGSIAERILGRKPIENLGVKPDIEYELSAFDLQNNYADYIDKIVESVLALIVDSKDETTTR